PQFLDSFGRVIFPERFAVFALARRGIQFPNDFLVVFIDDPIEEIASDTVIGVVASAGEIALGNLGAFAFWLVQEPAYIIGNAFDNPAGRARRIRIVPARQTILLN